MNKTPVVLSLAVALCAISCFCAPITTPPPSSTPAPSVPVNEEAKVSSLSLADVEDVMMDPSAKLRKFSDNNCKLSEIIICETLLSSWLLDKASHLFIQSCVDSIIMHFYIRFCSLAEAGG